MGTVLLEWEIKFICFMEDEWISLFAVGDIILFIKVLSTGYFQ